MPLNMAPQGPAWTFSYREPIGNNKRKKEFPLSSQKRAAAYRKRLSDAEKAAKKAV